MQLQPYVIFDGRGEEAIEFYKKAVGAKVNRLLRFKESPEPPPSGKFPPEMENKVMHANLTIGDSTMLVSDGHCTGKTNFAGFSLTLVVATETEADRVFAALSDGGAVGMPLAKTFFSPRFGMVTDRFGVGWMIFVGR
ncbi:MAG TPA: VOC family protein [Humisphaera sp.]|nr:VOC family protein [Humisphaera sp.]